LNASFPTASACSGEVGTGSPTRTCAKQESAVTVTAPARLHLGFLDLNGGLGRRFGSIGLAIGGLHTRLTIGVAGRGERAERAEIVGPERERVQRHLETMRRVLGIDAAHRVTIEEVIPAHAGLGSGTQLALGVAAALRRLHGLPLDAPGDAARLGRGARSGVGIGLFDRGGLVVDGGHGPMTSIAPIVSRIPFPDHWRVLVVLDPARHGLHGAGEGRAFAALPPMSEQAAAQLCRLTLIKALPALGECDLENFGAAIRDVQRILGDYFAAVQGGNRFTSPRVGKCIERLERAGAHGVGQSSWGPTGFAFAGSLDEAHRLVHLARQDPASEGLDILVSSGLNRGAAITARAAADAPQ
jgi:beta-ribofuranosylaminobenzene 5'-phosphate synthase